MKNEIRYSIIFIVLVLVISWSLSYVIVSKKETMELFPLLMFIPAIIGITINSFRYRSFKKVFKPITTKINLKSIIFSVLYPIIFIGIVAIAVYLSGIADFNSDKISELLTFPTIEIVIIGFLLMFGEVENMKKEKKKNRKKLVKNIEIRRNHKKS
jgi:CAAX protease family protein